MRICVISSLYPPYSQGGAERVASEEVRALKAAGNDVFVITASPVGDDGDASLKMESEGGVRVYRFYPLNLFFYGDIASHGPVSRAIWHLWDLINPHASSVIRKILLEEKPDIVHTHNLKGLGFGVPAMIRSLGIRHVHTLHDVQLAVPSGLIIRRHEDDAMVSGVPAKIYSAITSRLFGSPDIVISPSRFLLKFYESRGFFPRSEKIFLPNPAPEVKPQTPNPKPQQTNETRFLFLGQVERHKGILLLIQAFKKLLKERPDSRLEIVGTGSARKHAEAVVGSEMRVAFFGKKNPSAFAAMFGDADYVVVPSLCYENAPTVVLESFAHGIPVIVADIGGAAELVKDGKNGWTFRAGDVESLKIALKRAHDSRGAWEEMAREARRSAEPLEIRHHAERLVRIYEDKDHGLSEKGPVVPVRYQFQKAK